MFFTKEIEKLGINTVSLWAFIKNLKKIFISV